MAKQRSRPEDLMPAERPDLPVQAQGMAVRRGPCGGAGIGNP